MSSEQWFRIAHVALLIAVSCFTVPALIFVGAHVIDLTRAIKKRRTRIDAQPAVNDKRQMRQPVRPRDTTRPPGSIRSTPRPPMGQTPQGPQ